MSLRTLSLDTRKWCQYFPAAVISRWQINWKERAVAATVQLIFSWCELVSGNDIRRQATHKNMYKALTVGSRSAERYALLSPRTARNSFQHAQYQICKKTKPRCAVHRGFRHICTCQQGMIYFEVAVRSFFPDFSKTLLRFSAFFSISIFSVR